MQLFDFLLDQDVEQHDVPWPAEQVPGALGLLVAAVAIAMISLNHEFTSPNVGLAVIVVMALPWLLDAFKQPATLLRLLPLSAPLVVVWTLVVLLGAFWITWTYADTYEIGLFMVTILVGEMTAIAGQRYGALVWIAALSGLPVIGQHYRAPDMVIWGFAFTIGWLAGVAYRTQIRFSIELSDAQVQLAERAAEEERHRLARDVHDLIAHSLAVTMLQLSGARLALAAGDTDEALEALRDAESAGRSAMSEIHRTVGLLGHPSTEEGQRATPSAANLPDLVEGFRRAGLDVDFALAGDLVSVPLSAGLASYRVVQESLSNAVKHAPGAPVRLRVNVTDRDITIRVVNPVTRTTPVATPSHPVTAEGNGLRGMAERAELLGGVAAAGNGDGTWKVEACIPWEVTTT